MSSPGPWHRARRCVGGAAKIDDLVATHREQLAKARTVAVAGKGVAGKTADFLVLFSSTSAVESVRFVGGDEALRPFGDAIRAAAYGRVFPDDVPAKVLRRGVLACGPSGGGCAITFLTADNADPIK